MELYIIIGICAAILILAVVILVKSKGSSSELENISRIKDEMMGEMRSNREELSKSVTANFTLMQQTQSQQMEGFRSSTNIILTRQEERIKSFSLQNEQKLDNINSSIQRNLSEIRDDNNKKLEQMRATVDEKLQKTLDDKISQSFRTVSERLEQVYKGLGEMQTLAAGVGDLKKVLSNVKTRGILGEIQLGAILEQILSPEQYATNIATKKGSKAVVEFAVRLPGNDDGYVYLPIDSKFPGDTYSKLIDAYDIGDAALVDQCAKDLSNVIRKCAKDIHDKYIDPPNTTDFAILFLPFEGLYAEVVRRGLVEILQRDYKINIAGPTTMAALLNSLQMGFKTLAIQKRSGEVWNVLGAVKTEFNKFADVLTATQSRINQANEELDKLVGVRTRQIQRKLSTVSTLPEVQSAELLEKSILTDEQE